MFEMASIMHVQEARLGWRYCMWMKAGVEARERAGVGLGVETAGTTSHNYKVTLVNIHKVVMWRVWW